jgi:YtxH-like protein
MRVRKILNYDMDDVLDVIGLRRRSSALGVILPAIGLVAIGAAIGAGIGLMFAPTPGRRLRQGMSDRFDQMRERMKVEARKARKEGLLNATPEQARVSVQT